MVSRHIGEGRGWRCNKSPASPHHKHLRNLRPRQRIVRPESSVRISIYYAMQVCSLNVSIEGTARCDVNKRGVQRVIWYPTERKHKHPGELASGTATVWPECPVRVS